MADIGAVQAHLELTSSLEILVVSMVRSWATLWLSPSEVGLFEEAFAKTREETRIGGNESAALPFSGEPAARTVR